MVESGAPAPSGPWQPAQPAANRSAPSRPWAGRDCGAEEMEMSVARIRTGGSTRPQFYKESRLSAAGSSRVGTAGEQGFQVGGDLGPRVCLRLPPARLADLLPERVDQLADRDPKGARI